MTGKGSTMSQAEQVGDEWNVAEDDGVLDASDTLDDRGGDPLDTGIAAADRWTAANRFGTTPAEERAGDSLAHLLAQEEPDVDPYAEPADDEDELSRRGYEREARTGRLVADDQGFGEDEQADSVAWDVGIDGGAASAEEAAVHVVDDPFGPGDGPLR
ncbi:DUF5709 domain-containing protein [Micromonospora sp. WMMD1128]|uniref:DUF5709 domain-containing protein n=1 Tax=unclassified Micromonospora TaxID=2617518 RepID=UPI00248BCB8C|nr:MULTISPECIES: DUF5709 domain-containing protein [unclassified Micromonospora]WBB71818.1 DUF5709 domain-containing protein [Micromonospora sp. WMMD1128]WFE34736.1 DUF5709 domain-containing protein [Micromonospora sp. WMMD975]